MQKGKNMQYAMAGVQMMPHMRMNVRSNVRVPDGEAGYEYEGNRQPYYAAVQEKPFREHPTVPYRLAVPFLVALFLLFFGLAAGKLILRMNLTNDINDMDAHIKTLAVENYVLQNEVTSNRDLARISYLAQDLGMLSSSGVEMVPVVAPETRPQTIESSLTGSSPLPGGHGIISGSR